VLTLVVFTAVSLCVCGGSITFTFTGDTLTMDVYFMEEKFNSQSASYTIDGNKLTANGCTAEYCVSGNKLPLVIDGKKVVFTKQ